MISGYHSVSLAREPRTFVPFNLFRYLVCVHFLWCFSDISWPQRLWQCHLCTQSAVHSARPSWPLPKRHGSDNGWTQNNSRWRCRDIYCTQYNTYWWWFCRKWVWTFDLSMMFDVQFWLWPVPNALKPPPTPVDDSPVGQTYRSFEAFTEDSFVSELVKWLLLHHNFQSVNQAAWSMWYSYEENSFRWT